MREKLVELIRQVVIPYWAEQIADHLITNDVVPVVRCKDCKYHHYICPSGFLDRKADDFCSYGERKDGEG